MLKCFRNACLIIGITIFAAFWMSGNLMHITYKINADIASEGLLAREIWETGEWIPKTWIPSTETRIIGNPNLAALFYGMTQDMQLSLGIACCIIAFLILLAVFYMTACARDGACRKDVWSGLFMVLLCMVVPNDFRMLDLLYLFAGYYGMLTFSMCFAMGNYALSLKDPKRISLTMFLCMILAFFLGMQGMRGILMVFAPLFCVELLRCLSLCWKKESYKGQWIVGVWVFGLLAVSYAGTRMPFSVDAGASTNIRHGFEKLITDVLPGMALITGLSNPNWCIRICIALLLLLALGLLGYIFTKLFRKREVSPAEWVFVFLMASPAVAAVGVAFTTVDSSFRYFYVLNFALAFAPVLLLWLLPSGSKRHTALVCAGGCVVLALALADVKELYWPMLTADAADSTDIGKVAAYLAEHGIGNAYATFENANTITFIANGKVNAAPAASMETMEACQWLSSTRWYPPNVPEERTTAYVVTQNESEGFTAFVNDRQAHMEKLTEIGKYTIYISDYNYGKLIE